MTGFPFSEWMLAGIVAATTPKSTENRRTQGFCYPTTDSHIDPTYKWSLLNTMLSHAFQLSST